MSGEQAPREPSRKEGRPGHGSCMAPSEGTTAVRALTGRPRGRLRLAPPEHALVPGGAAGARASVIVAVGFAAALASSPGQSYWLSLFVDDMIAGTGMGRTGFSAVYAAATLFSAAMVLVVGAAFDRRGPSSTWVAVALGLAAGALLMSVATGAIVALGMLRAFGQGWFPLRWSGER